MNSADHNASYHSDCSVTRPGDVIAKTADATLAHPRENGKEAADDSRRAEVGYSIEFDRQLCTHCGLCAAFCPVEVIAMRELLPSDDQLTRPQPQAVAPELCWGCETCAGQCPQGAIRVLAQGGADPFASREQAPPLPSAELSRYRQWATTLKNILGLRWQPVAISLIAAGEPLPNVPVPSERLRYCQSLMAARRGRSLLMPANRHACPDGTSILGLTAMPAKLASGELYLLFHKLDNLQAARRMVGERPSLKPRAIDATLVTPLAEAAITPQVIAVIAQPEQVMWLLMSSSYYSGHRHDLQASGYNAQCVETTLLPYLTKQLNVSFGCYGCRASSDVGDDLMFVGIPLEQMETVIAGLRELGKKAIPQSRDKIYLPPMP